jgi:hypothetical protein
LASTQANQRFVRPSASLAGCTLVTRAVRAGINRAGSVLTYVAAMSKCGGHCPIEAGGVGRLADHECRQYRLAFDRTPSCGCGPDEGAVVPELPRPAVPWPLVLRALTAGESGGSHRKDTVSGY